MKHKFQKIIKTQSGFTIIEIIIVLAIVGVITAIVFVAVPEALIMRRDSARKVYAQSVLEAMEEFYKNNGAFPSCGTPMGCTGDGKDGADRFLANYLPDFKDPSTGLNYHTDNVVYANDSNGAAEAVEDNGTNTARYYWNNPSSHSILPGLGQLYIANAHWCYKTRADSYSTNGPLAGTSADNNPSNFAIVIYTERGGYYCLDNYGAVSTTPSS
jgi:prepilin-type N-terminal cleavage/methylation domain-containing protein